MDIKCIIEYPVLITVLFMGIFLYFRIARKYNIIDKPNLRSSHFSITIRGGGIIFWLAGVVYSVLNLPESLYFLVGLTLICSISFWDDVSSLPNRIRLFAHFAAIGIFLYGLDLFTILPWGLTVFAFILFVGILNAYNFMDGINGLTGLYSLSVLISLQYVNYKMIPFTNPDFIYYAILSCLVFLFFNFRKRAKCFAGDVGSMAISFWIVALLLQLMIKDRDFTWLVFLAVYGVDTICTILHRLFLRQNIFSAHRLHFYQVLTNEWGISHLKVSVNYAFIQLLICSFIIYFHECRIQCSIIAIIALVFLYLLKFRKIKNIDN
jgi:UDP-N-acetylmuramyl pentapeptide phosphotransferase/UDP-N-acetylglucosamine-1-phosphate transferase